MSLEIGQGRLRLWHTEHVQPEVDYSALLYPVPPKRIREYRARNASARSHWGVGAFGVLVLAVVCTLTIGSGPTITGGDLWAILGAAGFAVLFVLMSLPTDASTIEATIRYYAFARTNSLTFTPIGPEPSYPGLIFNIGHSRATANTLRSTSGAFLEISNYRYSEGIGRAQSHSLWGFMALRLDRELPHMVLDSKQNNGVFGIHVTGATNLPGFINKNQILSLEGDFDSYFTLYCPREYERDALYVFTPDLMALLIDNAAPFDVEIVDDWMFVYSATPFDSMHPQQYMRLFTIISTVYKKALRQTAHYSDERVGDFTANVVAEAGKRLRPNITAAVIVVGLIVVAIPVVMALAWTASGR